ncbi:MAG: adenylosuccinate synthase [Planctomycetes bacterium]|nr:adenylosuccinate synthase [Planctomycetota bacterium]
MPTLSIFGAQWGDEGKGKIIDLLAREADLVVRYQGGPNAGHTVVVGGEKFILRLIPSGILHVGKVNVIGNGVAIDPVALFGEIGELIARGVNVDPRCLRISAGAHVIFEHHRRIDALAERWRGAGRIGTTGRGIGPCYADKAARTGLRVADLVEPARLRTRLTAVLVEKNALIESVHKEAPFDIERTLAQVGEVAVRLAPFVADTGAEVRAAYKQGKSILFEGAQGAMLDIDHGTYPYVTSSNTGMAGIGTGAGFPPNKVERVLGIAKAYCTRVGEGPFPSEDKGKDGDTIREVGREFGSVTGRPRRCGWLDLVALRYALDLNGATGLILTNLDVLSVFPEIPVCVAYDVPGVRGAVSEYPAYLPALDDVRPRYERHAGWKTDISHVRRYADLPRAAREYVEWVEERIGVPIEMLSVGPERDAVIPRR